MRGGDEVSQVREQAGRKENHCIIQVERGRVEPGCWLWKLSRVKEVSQGDEQSGEGEIVVSFKCVYAEQWVKYVRQVLRQAETSA